VTPGGVYVKHGRANTAINLRSWWFTRVSPQAGVYAFTSQLFVCQHWRGTSASTAVILHPLCVSAAIHDVVYNVWCWPKNTFVRDHRSHGRGGDRRESLCQVTRLPAQQVVKMALGEVLFT